MLLFWRDIGNWFLGKKKTSTVYLKKILSHWSSWKLQYLSFSKKKNIYLSQVFGPLLETWFSCFSNPKKKHGFTPPASPRCLRTMPLNWRSASALGNVKQPVWEFPRNPRGSQLPVEPWEKGPLVVAGLYRAWLKLPSYVGYDNNPCTLPETFTVYSKFAPEN